MTIRFHIPPMPRSKKAMEAYRRRLARDARTDQVDIARDSRERAFWSNRTAVERMEHERALAFEKEQSRRQDETVATIQRIANRGARVLANTGLRRGDKTPEQALGGEGIPDDEDLAGEVMRLAAGQLPATNDDGFRIEDDDDEDDDLPDDEDEDIDLVEG